MRVVGNYGSTLLDYMNNNKNVSDIINYKVTGSALSNEAKANLKAHGITFGSDTDTDEVNEGYSQIKSSAVDLRTAIITLTNTDEGSLFSEENTDKTKVYSAVKDFVDSYNSMIEGMNSVGGTSNSSYKEELTALIKKNSEKLSKAGITLDKDGKLSLDEEVLKNADVEDIKKAFYSNTDFTEEVATKSIYVEANAISAMYSLAVSNYTNSASYSESYNTLLSNFTQSV